MVKELSPSEFDNRLSPIFEHISREANGPFDPDVLFPTWQNMMAVGIARTWTTLELDAVLGALFVPDAFNGVKRGLVYFWFSLPEARGTGRPLELLWAFEGAAKNADCALISISSHAQLTPEKTAHIYAKHGYTVSETVFTKKL